MMRQAINLGFYVRPASLGTSPEVPEIDFPHLTHSAALKKV
jgi:hypothetical protein